MTQDNLLAVARLYKKDRRQIDLFVLSYLGYTASGVWSEAGQLCRWSRNARRYFVSTCHRETFLADTQKYWYWIADWFPFALAYQVPLELLTLESELREIGVQEVKAPPHQLRHLLQKRERQEAGTAVYCEKCMDWFKIGRYVCEHVLLCQNDCDHDGETKRLCKKYNVCLSGMGSLMVKETLAYLRTLSNRRQGWDVRKLRRPAEADDFSQRAYMARVEANDQRRHPGVDRRKLSRRAAEDGPGRW